MNAPVAPGLAGSASTSGPSAGPAAFEGSAGALGDATEHHWTTPDGTRLWYSLEGADTGLDVVLCDGIGCNGFVWKYLRAVLRPLGRVVHLHMRGHGHSEAPLNPDAVGIDQLAADWVGLLQHLGSRRVVVLGHSLGVQVALELHRALQAAQPATDASGPATDAPGPTTDAPGLATVAPGLATDAANTEAPFGGPPRAEALVLLCGSFENPVATFRDSTLFSRFLPLIQQATRVGGAPLRLLWNRLIKLPAAYYVATRTELHPDLTRRHDVEAYLDHLARMDPPFFFRMLAQAGLHSARAHLPHIAVPVLVVAGARDQFTPARLSQAMAAAIPHATLDLIETGAHAAPVEHPTHVNLQVQRFLEAALGLAAAAPG